MHGSCSRARSEPFYVDVLPCIPELVYDPNLAELGSQRYDFSYFDTSDAVKIEPRNFERWAISASDPILYKPADVDGACQSMNFEVEPRRATGL
jgi:hypothetical protein